MVIPHIGGYPHAKFEGNLLLFKFGPLTKSGLTIPQCARVSRDVTAAYSLSLSLLLVEKSSCVLWLLNNIACSPSESPSPTPWCLSSTHAVRSPRPSSLKFLVCVLFLRYATCWPYDSYRDSKARLLSSDNPKSMFNLVSWFLEIQTKMEANNFWVNENDSTLWLWMTPSECYTT